MSTVAPPPPKPYRTPPPVRRALFVLAALFAVLMVAGATLSLLDAAARHTTTERTSYPDVRALVVDDASDISITGAPAGSPVMVTARVTGGLWNAESRVQRRADGTLELGAVCPAVFFGDCDVDYRIAVPSGTPVRADASAGDVDIERLVTTAPIELETSAGDVSVDDVEAPSLTLETSAGDVDLQGVRVREVRASSSAGDVSGSLLEAPDRLDLTSSAGDVRMVVPDVAYRVEVSSSAGDVDTREIRTDPDATREIRARTSAGDVQITARR